MRGAPQVGFPAIIRKFQLPNFQRQFFPVDLFSRLRDPTPVPSKTSAMPANDPLRIDQHQRLLPSTPETAGEYPEDSVNPPIRGRGCLRSARPVVAGGRDFPGAGFDAIASSG